MRTSSSTYWDLNWDLNKALTGIFMKLAESFLPNPSKHPQPVEQSLLWPIHSH